MTQDFLPSKKFINIVRKNDMDAEITEFIDSWLENIFMIGFGPKDADSVVSSYFMHQEIGDFKNNDVIEMLRESWEGEEFLDYCWKCEEEVDLLLLKDPYETCPHCEQHLDYWKDFGFAWSDSIPYTSVYYEYAKNIAESVYKKTLKKKLDNRVSGQSDLDVFKQICKKIFQKNRLRFMVYPHLEGGNTSWLYKDIFEDFYLDNFDEESVFDSTYLIIDTDDLLYNDIGVFFVDNWKDKVHLLKSFNGKIDLSLANLNPSYELKYFESRCYLKMDWTEKTRNIPKKKFLYSMPYSVIYTYLVARNLPFIFFYRPMRVLFEKYFEDKYYNLKFKLRDLLRTDNNPPF
tara:strand:- start:248 stop:1285 length:1038 start_codon:yes stop_codon:yes gene_type:complete